MANEAERLLASTAVAADRNLDFTLVGHRGVALFVDVTAVAGTSPTMDVKVQRMDPAIGTYRDIPGASLAQFTAAANSDLIIYPGIAETANRSVSDHPGPMVRIVLDLGGSDTPTVTMSVGMHRLM